MRVVARAARPAPGGDALHDEEPLSRLHVADATRLALDRVDARRVDEAKLELGLDEAQRLDLGAARRQLVPRLEIRRDRTVVEVDRDPHDCDRPQQPEATPTDLRTCRSLP